MRGFTLLELIIIIVIVSVLAGSVGYKIFSTTETSYGVGADQIVADIQYTQMLAMASLAQKSITFTSGSNTYNVAGESKNLPSGATATNTITFTFNSLGEPVAGGGQTVTVGTKQVKVWAITGKVEEL